MLRLTPLRKTSLCLCLFFLAPAAFAQSGEGRFVRAFVVDDRLSALRRDADVKSQIIQRLRLGRPLLIVGAKDAGPDSPLFYRVAVTRRTRGWIHEAALAVPGRKGQDARVLRLIETAGDGLDRITLCRLFVDRFGRSPLAPRALLAMGQEADRAATSLGQRARRRLASFHEKSMIADARDYYLNDPALDRYSRLRINFDFVGATSELVYDGQAYRDLVARFPGSEEAAQARERLAAARRKQAP